MENDPKRQIYKGIIQFLLETTNYSLQHIAALSNSSIKNIRAIYCENQLPQHFPSEKQLVQLYLIVLELNNKKETRTKKVARESKYENSKY